MVHDKRRIVRRAPLVQLRIRRALAVVRTGRDQRGVCIDGAVVRHAAHVGCDGGKDGLERRQREIRNADTHTERAGRVPQPPQRSGGRFVRHLRPRIELVGERGKGEHEHIDVCHLGQRTHALERIRDVLRIVRRAVGSRRAEEKELDKHLRPVVGREHVARRCAHRLERRHLVAARDKRQRARVHEIGKQARLGRRRAGRERRRIQLHAPRAHSCGGTGYGAGAGSSARWVA